MVRFSGRAARDTASRRHRRDGVRRGGVRRRARVRDNGLSGIAAGLPVAGCGRAKLAAGAAAGGRADRGTCWPSPPGWGSCARGEHRRGPGHSRSLRLLAFAWGLFGSTIARTTLGSVGLAIPAAVLTAVVVLVPVLMFFQSRGTNLPRPRAGLVPGVYVRHSGGAGRRGRSPGRTVSGPRKTPPAAGDRGWASRRPVARRPAGARARAGDLQAFALVAGLSLLAPGCSR